MVYLVEENSTRVHVEGKKKKVHDVCGEVGETG